MDSDFINIVYYIIGKKQCVNWSSFGKADYRYAPSVYYDFPMPEMTEESKEAIEKTQKMF